MADDEERIERLRNVATRAFALSFCNGERRGRDPDPEYADAEILDAAEDAAVGQLSDACPCSTGAPCSEHGYTRQAPAP